MMYIQHYILVNNMAFHLLLWQFGLFFLCLMNEI
jgi:hypothetical protein